MRNFRFFAAFLSRVLLPSRLRVPPSSQRKAHSDQLHCHRSKVCRFLLLKSRKFPLFPLRHRGKNVHNQRLPPRGSWRRRRLRESARLSVFRRLLVPRSPSVTLTRATFLPEEGSCLHAAQPLRKSVQTFSFENSNSAFVSSVAQRKNVHKQRLPPRGSCRQRRLRESARLAFFCCFRF